MSACSVTVVVTWLAAAEPSLFPGVGSAVLLLADPMLSSVPVDGAVTVTVRVTLAPLAKLETAGQVTTPPDSVPPLLAETNVTPDGRLSFTTTLVAGEGPLLVVTRV